MAFISVKGFSWINEWSKSTGKTFWYKIEMFSQALLFPKLNILFIRSLLKFVMEDKSCKFRIELWKYQCYLGNIDSNDLADSTHFFTNYTTTYDRWYLLRLNLIMEKTLSCAPLPFKLITDIFVKMLRCCF